MNDVLLATGAILLTWALLIPCLTGIGLLVQRAGRAEEWSYPVSVDSSPLSSPGPSWSPLVSFMNGGAGAKPPRSPSA